MSKRRKKISSIIEWWGGEHSFSVAPSILGTSTPAVGLTSAAAAIPAVTVEAGMGIIIVTGTKLAVTRPYPPSGGGYRRLPFGWGIAATSSQSTDNGPVGQTVMTKTAVGGESGTVTIDTINGSGTNGAVIATTFIIAKDPSAYLHFNTVWGAHNTPGTASYSARSNQKMNLKTGDKLLVVTTTNADGPTWASQAMTAISGLTIVETTEEIYETGTNTGNDIKQTASLYTITAGNVTDFLTFTATITNGTAGNPIGITHFIRIRQRTTAQEFRTSGLNNFSPANLPAGAVVTNSSYVNGAAVEVEPSNNITIGTYLGKTVYMLDADYRDAVIRRRQELGVVPDRPALPEGTITNWGWDFYTDDYKEAVNQGIICQAHTGSAGADHNHPVIYFERLSDTQDPVGNGGILNIAYGMAALDTGVENSIRIYEQPQINGQYISLTGTKHHYIKCEAKWHRVTGYLLVWYKNDSDVTEWVQIINATNIKTMADTAPELGNGEANTGSTPLVGPRVKIGPYDHQNNVPQDLIDNMTPPYEHDRNLMMPSEWLLVDRLPTDIDYDDTEKARIDTDPSIVHNPQ